MFRKHNFCWFLMSAVVSQWQALIGGQYATWSPHVWYRSRSGRYKLVFTSSGGSTEKEIMVNFLGKAK
jgi:hypothetical protein